MYGYLLDHPEQDTIRAAAATDFGIESPALDAPFVTAYQRQRQRAYDRARHMTRGGAHGHPEVEDAKTEAALVEAEAKISRTRGDQLAWIQALLLNNSAVRFGYRSAVDYVVSRVDVHRSTARDLVYLAERLDGGVIEQVRRGEVSYVRVLEETRLREAGATPEVMEHSRDLDLDKVTRVAQQHRRMTRESEKHIFESQYVAFQPSLDGTHVRLSGRLGAAEAEICRQGLDQRGEDLVPAGEPRPDPGLRRALALTTLCQDQLDDQPASAGASGDEGGSARSRREPLLMLVAQQPIAEESGFEQGVSVLGGDRVGPDTTDLVKCQGRIESITLTGQEVVIDRALSGTPPTLRRAVLARDGGCTISGCNSTYRLEVHHIIPRSEGGDHSPGNLTTLCWWHHHVAVHRRGLRIDPQSPPQRRRLLPTRTSCGYRPPSPDPNTLTVLRALRTPTGRAPP